MIIGIDATALIENRTGIGNYIYPILKELVQTRADSTFLLYSNDAIEFPEFPNVKFRISSPKRRGPFWQNTQLYSMLKQDCPDVFWGSNGILPLFKPQATATVLTIYDLVYRFAPHTMPWSSRWGRRLLQPLSARAANRLIVISEATGKDVEQIYGRQPHATVPPLPSTGFTRASEADISTTADRLKLPPHYLLALGTLEPRKNLANLISAYLHQRKTNVELPPLLLAGGKGWLDTEIDTMITKGEHEGFIRRLGYVDSLDLPGLYAGCDAFIMPSLYEGFGMPLLEAQLCGAPVIHGPHCSMREASGNLGVVSNTDFQSLSKLLKALAEQRLPLACRHPATYSWNAEQAADIMWRQFLLACGN